MRNRIKLRLYIFEEFMPDYGDGLAFAIAANEKEAKKLIAAERECSVHIDSKTWGSVQVKRLDQRIARSVAGSA